MARKIDDLTINKLMKPKQMNQVRGGASICTCSCYWEGNTGSTVSANMNANSSYGIPSRHGCNQYVKINDDIEGYCPTCDESN